MANSSQDFTRDNRASLITFSNSRPDVDIESGARVKGKLAESMNNQTIFLSWMKKVVPFFGKFQSTGDSLDDSLTNRDSSSKLSKSSMQDVAIDTVNSAPSSVTFRIPSDSSFLIDTRKQFISDFVAKEMLYHSELQQNFAKISSHLDILNHLGGGEYLKTYDQELVDGLLKISLYFIQRIRIAPQIEWREEFEELRLKFEDFAYEMENYMSKFEKVFPGSSPALERTSFTISGIRDRLEIYQRICLIPANAAYWHLSSNLRNVIDVFYKKEKEYSKFLRSQPEALEQFQNLGILDTDSGKAGLEAAKSLLKLSEELAEQMIYNPCTYGLIHRKMDIAEAFDAHAKYTSTVMERLYDYRDTTSRTWHQADEELSDEQLEELIAAFKRDLAKPVDRLIHFQHLLELFKSDVSIDQNQVTFAKFVVDGVLKKYLVQHAYQITPTLTPKWN